MPSVAPFGQAVSEKIFLTLANQKKKLIHVCWHPPFKMAAVF
jgi:hypothetical protein